VFFVGEQGRRVVEHLLLPAVEDRGKKAVLVAQIGDRDLLKKMLSKNRGFLLGGEVAAFFSHGFPLGVILHQIGPEESQKSCGALQMEGLAK
jgi:hypothetical protein